MPRPNKPWRRKSAGGAWYAKVDGKQVPLAPADASKAAAEKILRALLVERDRGRRAPASAPQVGELIEGFLADCNRRVESDDLAPITRDSYLRRLKSFVPLCGRMRADQIRPKDVAAWIAGQNWGATSRHDGVAAVKAVFRWARRMGHIEADPLAEMAKPRRNERRQLTMGEDDWPKLLASIKTPEFRDLLTFLHATGARPGEAFRLEETHIDWSRGIAVMRGKSTHQTGKARVIHLGGETMAMCRTLADRNPHGPIFRNSRGNPWSKDSVNCQIRRIRQRSGLGREVVSYALRHLFATDALESEVPMAAVAELLGHSDTRVLSRVYSHLSDRNDYLKGALDRVRPPEASPGPSSSDPSSHQDASPNRAGPEPGDSGGGPAD